MQAGKAMMGAFERREAEKRDAERAKNDLEAYIISTGGVLGDGAFDEVSPATPPLQKATPPSSNRVTAHSSSRRSSLHEVQRSVSCWGG